MIALIRVLDRESFLGPNQGNRKGFQHAAGLVVARLTRN